MATPTPEGYNYYFSILCLYSAYVWILLAKATSEWKIIWPKFVSECEARERREKCIFYLITDNHKVHVQGSISKHNMQKGIREDFSSPYDQWQEPTERVFGTLNQAATVSSIQGGAKALDVGLGDQKRSEKFQHAQPAQTRLGDPRQDEQDADPLPRLQPQKGATAPEALSISMFQNDVKYGERKQEPADRQS
jgi:hypothetical protein